jgi:hypothetical protein
VPFYDSWLLAETYGLKILNTNDCVVDGEAIASDIAKHTGNVDVLLTQFSYANWIGNPEDLRLRKESAREKLERVKIQVNTFAPKYTVPFASLVYFSPEENRYMKRAGALPALSWLVLAELPLVKGAAQRRASRPLTFVRYYNKVRPSQAVVVDAASVVCFSRDSP